jgi:hypothetical protein
MHFLSHGNEISQLSQFHDIVFVSHVAQNNIGRTFFSSHTEGKLRNPWEFPATATCREEVMHHNPYDVERQMHHELCMIQTHYKHHAPRRTAPGTIIRATAGVVGMVGAILAFTL